MRAESFTMKKKTYKKGLVIVMVLWVVVLLTIIVASVARSGQIDTKLCIASIDSIRCKWAARAGIETAKAVLNEDSKESDSFIDLWSYNVEEFSNVQLGNSSFNVVVTDESGKLNLNTTTRNQLLMLPNMTEQIADAILDWRDSDDEPNQSGVESGYYQGLQFGYKIRNGPFRTLRELLLIRGMTEELLYGYNTSSDGQSAYSQWEGIANVSGDTSESYENEPWINYLTCHSYDSNLAPDGSARVNINTAAQSDLVDLLGLSEQNAAWIVQTRRTSRFTSIADLLSTTTTTTGQTSGQSGQSGAGTGQGTAQTAQSSQATALDVATFASIAEKITVNDANRVVGKININTAPRYVLLALLADVNNAEQFADNIISYRDNLPYGITSIGELVSVLSMDVASFKKIADLITVRSYVFTVRSFAITERGDLTTAQLQTEEVIDRSSRPNRVLYRYQGKIN